MVLRTVSAALPEPHPGELGPLNHQMRNAGLKQMAQELHKYMAEMPDLKEPWMVAVWPGMGQVALSAGYYLMAKLQMRLFAEFRALDLFDVENVEVDEGLIQSTRLPRSRFFVWNDPNGQRDIVLFVGEAQPPVGKYAFCQRVMEVAGQLGVERVFTFASMATQAQLQDDPRVFLAATNGAILSEFEPYQFEVLKEGQIGGLNGLLLGVAAQNQLNGACLLGEMPFVFARVPFPKASLAVLERFAAIASVGLDFTELRTQVQMMEQQLHGLLNELENAMQERESQTQEDPTGNVEETENHVDPEDERRIEQLFAQAADDRSKAYELKRELDRLGVFPAYEDRFLDLFKPSE
jgi:hypothetical protein